MFCGDCGAPVDGQFCSACGTGVRRPPNESSARRIADPPTSTVTPSLTSALPQAEPMPPRPASLHTVELSGFEGERSSTSRGSQDFPPARGVPPPGSRFARSKVNRAVLMRYASRPLVIVGVGLLAIMLITFVALSTRADVNDVYVVRATPTVTASSLAEDTQTFWNEVLAIPG